MFSAMELMTRPILFLLFLLPLAFAGCHSYAGTFTVRPSDQIHVVSSNGSAAISEDGISRFRQEVRRVAERFGMERKPESDEVYQKGNPYQVLDVYYAYEQSVADGSENLSLVLKSRRDGSDLQILLQDFRHGQEAGDAKSIREEIGKVLENDFAGYEAVFRKEGVFSPLAP